MSTRITVPQLGESVVEARVARWLKQEGDVVDVGEPVVELETDKIDLEVGAERGGVLASIERQSGEDVRVGDVLGVIEEGQAGRAERPPPSPAGDVESRGDGSASVRATPTAKTIARAHAVDLSRVEGSGIGGRITKSDVQSNLRAQPSPAPPADARGAVARPQPAAAPPPPRPPAPEGPEPREERIRMSRRRLTIARNLVEAQRAAAMLTTFNEADMSAVMALRARRKESFKKRHGVSLGIVSFFVKASVAALAEFPRLNAEIDGEEIVLKRYYDIGIAVGDARGLVVPVIRDAGARSFAGIEASIHDFATRAQAGTLTLEDLRGGTFTITNGGVFGSLLSTPILNPPQVGILGLHKIEDRPIASNGEVVIRPMMYLALTYDHRIVDGLEAVQFLVRLKTLIEDPGVLLLEA
jgi:2-oxoglutarate dehydrogenase E2 component (dihydrolipoamide succinyltransferase)